MSIINNHVVYAYLTFVVEQMQNTLRGSLLGRQLICNRLKSLSVTMAKCYSIDGRPTNFKAVIFDMGGVVLPSPLKQLRGKAKKKIKN